MDSQGIAIWNELTTDQAHNDDGGNTGNVESSVAFLMYNATSPTGLALPNTVFADISHSCEIFANFGFGRTETMHPDGTDLVLMCAQQSLTGDDVSKLTARSLTPTHIRPGRRRPAASTPALIDQTGTSAFSEFSSLEV